LSQVRYLRSTAAVALLLASAAVTARAQSRAAAPVPARAATQPALTAADLRTRLFIYADDSMQGRQTGSAGNAKATAYIAAEVRRLGLEPAGDSGGYFQNVPVVRSVLDTTGRLRADTTLLQPWTDYLMLSPALVGLPIGLRAVLDAPVVFGGRVNNPLLPDSMNVAGKIVVFSAPLGPDGHPMFGFDRRLFPRFGAAAAIVIVVLDYASPGVMRFLRASPMQVAGETPPPGPVLLFASGNVARQLFSQPLDSLTAGAAGRRLKGTVAFMNEATPAPARNVVAILRGSDPALRNQFVAIGAHNDHIGTARQAVEHDSIWAFNHVLRPNGAETNPGTPNAAQWTRVNAVKDSMRALHPARQDSVFNGADDDGSGTVTVLEIAEDLAAQRQKPKRSVLFVWHVGEEEGLFGSTWFTDHPTVPRDSIVSQLNIDMVGRGDATDLPGGNPGYLQLIGSHRLSTELGNLVESVNTTGKHGFTFDYQFDANGHPEQYYCRSDHYEYARYGIPIVFFSTGNHPDYHMLTDEPQYINYDHMARVAGLIEDILLHVANLDHRVVVDHPKPDPRASCRQ
jgi:hypothetical protein